jgi:nucleoside-diphosphate-sugar epimerase
MLIVGCGYLGRQVGAHYLAQGQPVTGVVRSAASSRTLAAQGILPLQVDLDAAELPSLPCAEARVFYFAPPTERGTTDPRVRRLVESFKDSGQPGRIVYMSTTGVYGDCHGAWVDETHPVTPRADRARRRLDAERALQRWHRDSGGQLVILRVAGIYGPGRLPLQRLREGLPVVRDAESPFTNRIHVQDLVQVCVAAMDRGISGRIYNACDGHPSTMADYFRRLAELAGLPPAPQISLVEAPQRLSPGMLSYMEESRRLSNRRIVEELGVELKYPSLESGLPACFAPDRGLGGG